MAYPVMPMDAEKLLYDILSIPSVNGKDDEGKVAEYVAEVLSEAGLETELIRIDEKHANVIATLEGDASDEIIVWNGHIDTVPYGDLANWDTDPRTPVLKDGRVYVRGASDMKSGIAAMTYALASYKKSGKKVPRTIVFIADCDEERGGLGSSHAAENSWPSNARELLLGEPTGLDLGIAQKGCLWLEMKCYGKASHGAYPEQGVNAIEKGFQLAASLKSYIQGFSHSVLGQSTAQITEISGGTAPNMTADFCRFLMDIRMVPGLTKDMVTAKAAALADEITAQTDGLFKTEFNVMNSKRAIEADVNHDFVKKLVEVLREKGAEPKFLGINYFTDAANLVKEGNDIPVVLFGPGEADLCHKPNECLVLEKYHKAIEVYTELIARG